jgi:hypothetical protein
MLVNSLKNRTEHFLSLYLSISGNIARPLDPLYWFRWKKTCISKRPVVNRPAFVVMIKSRFFPRLKTKWFTALSIPAFWLRIFLEQNICSQLRWIATSQRRTTNAFILKFYYCNVSSEKYLCHRFVNLNFEYFLNIFYAYSLYMNHYIKTFFQLHTLYRREPCRLFLA